MGKPESPARSSLVERVARPCRARAMVATSVILALGLAASVAVAGTATSSAKQLKIAILLPGKKNDHSFSQAGYDSLRLAAKQTGAKMAVAESVPTAQQTQAYRNFASAGYDLIVGWGGQYNDGGMQVTKDFPNTHVVVLYGFGGHGKFASIVPKANEWTYMLGYLAGLKTKSNKVGAIVGTCFPIIAQEAYGFEAGAKAANPKVSVSKVSLSSFDDPAAAKEAASAMISNGVDIIQSSLNTGNKGVYQAARENKGVLVVIQNVTSFSKLEAPEVTLTGTADLISATRFVVPYFAKQVKAGTFTGKDFQIPTPTSASQPAIAPFHGLAPKSLYAKILGLQNRIARGAVKVPAKSNCPLK